MKFMLCLDGSKLSESAIPICTSLATAANADVEIVRVIEHGPIDTGEAYSGNITLSPELVKSLDGEDTRLVKHLDDLTSRFPGTASTHLLHGRETAQVLIEEAVSKGADLIVMATHSRSGAGEAPLGSVARDVTKNSGIPVLLVHPAATASPAMLPAGAYVFTSDGQELGKLRDAGPGGITIESSSGDRIHLAAADVAGIEGGRILLHYDVSDLPVHLSQAAPA